MRPRDRPAGRGAPACGWPAPRSARPSRTPSRRVERRRHPVGHDHPGGVAEQRRPPGEVDVDHHEGVDLPGVDAQRGALVVHLLEPQPEHRQRWPGRSGRRCSRRRAGPAGSRPTSPARGRCRPRSCAAVAAAGPAASASRSIHSATSTSVQPSLPMRRPKRSRAPAISSGRSSSVSARSCAVSKMVGWSRLMAGAQRCAPAADDLGDGGDRRLPAGEAGASHGTSSMRTAKRRARPPAMTAYRRGEREVAGHRR